MMSAEVIRFLTIFWLLFVIVPNTTAKRQWDFEVLSIVPATSDESKLKMEAQIIRIGRGEFAFSAKIEWNYDVDDTTMVEGKCYRSNTGVESDYKLLPFDIPKQPYRDFLDKHYKGLVLKNLGDCSNLPRYENEFVPPWPKDTYVFDKCMPNATDYPDVVLEGFYKMVMEVTGPVDWGFTAILRIFYKFL